MHMALRISHITIPSSFTQKSYDHGLASANEPKQTKQSMVVLSSTKTRSPVREEEVGFRFGFEMAVAEIERLYGQQGILDKPPPAVGSPERRRLRVAYQGVRGSYCQEAAELAFPSSSVDALMIPCGPPMEDVFSALEDGFADRAVVPAENSIDGTVRRNLDLLLRHPSVSIVGELIVPVNHCLLSLPGVPVSSIRRIVSHPQALSHCASGLESLGLKVESLEIEEIPCIASAAKFLAEEQIRDGAVIASRTAAREFGLHIVEANFQDTDYPNFIRFLQLGLNSGATGIITTKTAASAKTMVAFALEKGTADLWRAMWCFESRGVTLKRIDHCPNRRRPLIGSCMMMDYVFVLDVEGSASGDNVAAALRQLSELSNYLRVLGCYN